MVLIVIFCISVWLDAIRQSQLSPHKITQSINGKVFNQFWETNPAYISYDVQSIATTNGLKYFSVPRTNYYWTVWSIWK
jgi:hypothetical protein